MKKLICTLLLLQSLTQAKAEVTHDEVMWININSFIKLQDNWQLYTEIQPRFASNRDYLGTVLYRVALGYEFPTKLSFWAGYGHIEGLHPTDFHEHRPFLQVMKVQDDGRARWINRFRLEYRNLQNRDESPLRARYLLRQQFQVHEMWHLVIWNELFYDLSGVDQNKSARSPKPRPGFDQNRFFVGPGIKLKSPLDVFIELGYLNVFINGAQGKETILNGLAGQAILRF